MVSSQSASMDPRFFTYAYIHLLKNMLQSQMLGGAGGEPPPNPEQIAAAIKRASEVTVTDDVDDSPELDPDPFVDEHGNALPDIVDRDGNPLPRRPLRLRLKLKRRFLCILVRVCTTSTEYS